MTTQAYDPSKKTETIFLQGKAKYCWVTKANEFGDYKVQLYPNPKSLEIIQKLKGEGLKNHLKKDDDGYYMAFKRPLQKMMRGKIVSFTPPELQDAEGNPTQVLIGNGSDVEIKLSVYQHATPGGGKAKAARLEGVRIYNLVPYTVESYDESQQKQAAGMADRPTPAW